MPTLPDFAAFQREVKKALKADIPLKQRNEWEDEIRAKRTEINALTAEIARLEGEINAKVGCGDRDLHQRLGCGVIGSLATGQDEADRQSLIVAARVDFARKAAA